MADFICLNYFATELNGVLEPDDLSLPIPVVDANRLCEALGVDSCAGCLPGDDPPVSVDSYTRLMIHHNGRFEIVMVTGCDSGVPIIERGQEGSEPLRFPIGTCVQFVWTCANVMDAVGDVAENQQGLTFSEVTNMLGISFSGASVVDLSSLAEDIYATSMSYDKPSNQITLTLNNGANILTEVSPYTVSVAYNVGTEVLTITLSDGTVLNTTIPQATFTDIYLTGATYDNVTQILTLPMSNGSNYAVNLGALYGLNLTGVSFNTTSNILTFTMSDASTFTVDLTSLDEHVTGATFSNITNILTLQKNIGGNITVDLSDLAENTVNTTLSFNLGSNTLVLDDSDGGSVSVDLSVLRQHLQSLAFNGTTNILTATMYDGTPVTAFIGNATADTFTTTDGKTVTVSNGFVTSIV